MIQLNFPEYEFIIRREGNRLIIFDPVRKKYVTLTPEEWVRQHVINYLVNDKGFPVSLISAEGNIRLYKTSKRYDVVAFDRNGNPLLIVECKSPDIKLDQNVVDQVIRYNLTLRVNYLIITNGMRHFCLKRDTQKDFYIPLDEIPSYNELIC